jgi:hypothetical protein
MHAKKIWRFDHSSSLIDFFLFILIFELSLHSSTYAFFRKREVSGNIIN